MAIKSVEYLIALLLVLLNYKTMCFQFYDVNLNLDKQYELLKKPSIKTIKTRYGDTYDCVDFYKQPAFDHPLLKNHSFHPRMRPSFVPKTRLPTQEGIFIHNVELSDDQCPKGTVPIRRMSKKEFIKSRQFTKDYGSRLKSNDMTGVPGDHYALLETNTGPSTVYKGVGGTCSIHGGLPIKASQYTSGGVFLRNGNDIIQAGWTINSSINNDSYSRFFQYFSAGTSHCFNTQCPGFVHLEGSMPIDHVFKPVTELGGAVWTVTIIVFKDPKDGNWWLAIDNAKHKRKHVGFWPRQIFSTMKDAASYIAVGGEAYGPLSERLPAMGNGYKPTRADDIRLAAFCSHFYVMDGDSIIIDNPQITGTYSDDDSHYSVRDLGKKKRFFDEGRIMFYGGTSKL